MPLSIKKILSQIFRRNKYNKESSKYERTEGVVRPQKPPPRPPFPTALYHAILREQQGYEEEEPELSEEENPELPDPLLEDVSAEALCTEMEESYHAVFSESTFLDDTFMDTLLEEIEDEDKNKSTKETDGDAYSMMEESYHAVFSESTFLDETFMETLLAEIDNEVEVENKEELQQKIAASVEPSLLHCKEIDDYDDDPTLYESVLDETINTVVGEIYDELPNINLEKIKERVIQRTLSKFESGKRNIRLKELYNKWKTNREAYNDDDEKEYQKLYDEYLKESAEQKDYGEETLFDEGEDEQVTATKDNQYLDPYHNSKIPPAGIKKKVSWLSLDDVRLFESSAPTKVTSKEKQTSSKNLVPLKPPPPPPPSPSPPESQEPFMSQGSGSSGTNFGNLSRILYGFEDEELDFNPAGFMASTPQGSEEDYV